MLRFRGRALICVLFFCALASRALGQAVDIKFVDASGLPITEMLEDDTARVRVTDPAANTDPAVAETLTAQLQTLYTQDQETLALTETGPDTGVFKGSIHLNIAPYGTTYNGILDTGNSNSPDYHPDEVTATFGAATATARMIGSRVSFIDDFGRTTSVFPVGAWIGVRLEQPVSDNPGIWDHISSFQIQLRNGNATGYYYLTLDETGRDTGVFEGRISSSATSNSQSVVPATVGLSVQAVSVGPYTPTVSTASAAFIGGQVLFVDALGQPASVYMEGTRAYLRVVNHLTSGTVTAQVTAEVAGDQETVSLQETSSGSGIFQGSIRLLSTPPGTGAPGNGTLETAEALGPVPRYDTLHASYADSSGGTSSVAASTVGYRIGFIDAYGSVASSYPQGTRAYVRIEWHNFTNPNAVDTIAVRLRSAPGDDETFPAVETGKDTGIFEGSMPLTGLAVSLGNGQLEAAPGDEITADRDGVAVPRPVSARIEFASVTFIDDAGRPTAEVLQEGRAWVRVVSPVDNHNAAAVETVVAQVRSRYELDVENLTLTETGANTDVFEGSIPLAYTQSNALPGNGRLETRDSGDVPNPKPEELTATFGGYSAKATMVGSRVVFIDDFGRETSTFPVGANVGIRVVEPASNDPHRLDTIDYFQLLIGQKGPPLSGYYRYLTLYETSRDTGVFEERIPSSPNSTNQYVIVAGVGQLLQGTRLSPNSPTAATAEATFVGGQVLFVDALGQPASVYLEGTRAYLRVVNHLTSGPLTVQVTADLTGDQENVTLQQTSSGSGIFQGSIRLLSTSPGTGAPGNGTLETAEALGPDPRYDTLHASYTDSSGGTSSVAASTVGYRIGFIDAYGSVVSSYPQGARAYVRIEWHNFTNPNAVDTIAVRLRSSSGDDESFPAIETGKDTGIFEGSLPLAGVAVSLGNGQLEAAPGDEITADRDGAAVSRPASASIEFASVTFVDDAGRPTAEVVQEGLARVRVVSPVDNHNAAALETVAVQVRSRYELDVENLTLKETGADTGVFEGSIPLTFTQSNALPGNGRLETRDDGDYPHPKPEELTATFGGYSAKAITVGSRIVFIDNSGRETATFPVGANVGVRLVEPASNNPQTFDTIDSFQLAVVNGFSTSYYYLTLNETGRNTGVFEGWRPSSPNSASPNIISAGAGQLIQATRFSPLSSTNAATAQATFTGGQVLFVDAQGKPASVYLQGTQAYLRVEDHFRSGPLTMQVTADLTGDQESVSLQETSPGAGVFQGSIGLRLAGAVVAGNGTLETTEVFGPPFRFDILRASYLDSTAAVSTLGYRIWFIDAAGAVVSSYSPGSRVYVRLEEHNHNNPGQIDKTFVQLDSATGDHEGIEVYETSLATGIYEGSILLDSGAVALDGRLQAHGGEEITADRSSAWFPAPVHAVIDSASVGFIDLEGLPTVLVPENGTARVRVGSVQDNVNSTATDSIVVQLHSRYAEDAESVTLTETGPDTGVFEGAILLRLDDTPAAGNGTLETRFSPNDNDPAPEELTAIYGPYSAMAHTEVVRLAFVNLRGQEVTTYPLRSTVRLRVEVHVDTTPAIDTFQVSLQSNWFDYQDVTMTETGADTGIFLGSAPSSDQPTDFNDGVLSASAGQTLKVRVFTRYGVSPTIEATVGNAYAPQPVDDTAEVAEGSRVSIDVLANDIAGGGPLSVTQVTQGAHGSVVIDSSGTVTYSPAAGFTGTDSFTYLATDSQGGEALATVTVTITPRNRAPVANADTATVEEDGIVDVAVLGNDSDPDGDTLTVDSVTQGTHGTVAINPDKTVKYTPAENYSGADSFTYTVSDGNGGTATATVTITVTSANDAPVANADTDTVAEDGTVNLTVLTNDTDADDDTLTVASVTQGTHGAVAINPDKTVKYTPASNYNGADSFTYTVSDGNGGTATATVTVAVSSVNDAPAASADSATVAEDGTVNVAVLGNDSDLDGDTLTVASVTQGAHGTVMINPDKSVKYTPALNYNGADSFTYTVSDGNGGTAMATVTVTVSSVNDAPAASADSATVAEDGTVNVTVLANDPDADGDTLAVASVTQGTHGAVAINPDKTVKYTPATNYNGADSFTYTVSDGNGGTATATVTVTVSSVNDAPAASADSATVAEDGTVNVTVLANDTDADGDTLAVASVTQGTHGAVAINPDKTVKYTPAANYNGADSFTYTVSDGNGGTATATVTATVSSVNDAPAASADSATVAEDGTVNVAVLGNDSDPDGDTLTVASVTQGAHGTVVINPDKTVKYTPAANYNDADSFTYTVSDSNGGTATATVSVTVTSSNDAPVANADSATVTEDGTVNVTVLTNDTDADGDTLAVASVTQGTHGAASINANGTVAYTPAANYNGPDSFTYTVSDGNGGTATATVSVTVTSSNDAPVANADAATLAEDGIANITVLTNDTDADGDTLTVASVTQGVYGTVAINPDKTVKYTPAANYNGADSFTYTVSDGNGGTATATVAVTVTSSNDAPVANADAATVAEDGLANVAVLANDSDPDGNVLSVASVTQGAHGSVIVNPDKTVRYTPAANYSGSDAFTYTISDGSGGTATATVTINVMAVNDAPVAVNDSATVTAGGTATVSVLTNDADVDGPSLAVTSVTQGAHGAVAISGSQVTYTAALYVGADSFTYTVSDGAGGTATATVTVNVTAPQRVATGIQARYNFNEGSGSTVSDSSGVGTPLNLTVASPTSVSWISGGLKVNTATSIASPGSATKIISAAQASNALTVEAWIQPASLTLTGPARILTLTKTSSQRNLVFGQSGSRYETQLKTSTGTPSLQSPASSLSLSLTHVVYTRTSSGQAVYYINGVQVSTLTTTGTFATWGTDHKLILSDNWQGSYFLMAVYGRALTNTEVQQNYLAGANGN
jgi:VCBS repeat-containing protein